MTAGYAATGFGARDKRKLSRWSTWTSRAVPVRRRITKSHDPGSDLSANSGTSRRLASSKSISGRRPNAIPAPAIAAPIAALKVSKRTIVAFAPAPSPTRSSQVDHAFSVLEPLSSSRLWRSKSSGRPSKASDGLQTGKTVSPNSSRSPSAALPGRARRMARSMSSRTMSGSCSMARTCHCTEGCCAAKAASKGASQSEATDPFAEIASIGREPFARTRTASHAAASSASAPSMARSKASPSAVGAVRVTPAPFRARVSSAAPSAASSPRT